MVARAYFKGCIFGMLSYAAFRYIAILHYIALLRYSAFSCVILRSLALFCDLLRSILHIMPLLVLRGTC